MRSLADLARKRNLRLVCRANQQSVDECIAATKIKLESMIRSYLLNSSELQVLSPHSASTDRQRNKIRRLRDVARTECTFRCGAYLAHARHDLSYEQIEQILVAAGGDPEAVLGIRSHLVMWRDNFGYDDKVAAK